MIIPRTIAPATSPINSLAKINSFHPRYLVATIFPSSLFIRLFIQSLPVRKHSLEGQRLGLFPHLIPCWQVSETLPSSPLSQILCMPVRGAVIREPDLLPLVSWCCLLTGQQGTKPNPVAQSYFAIARLHQHPKKCCCGRSRAPGAARGSSAPAVLLLLHAAGNETRGKDWIRLGKSNRLW